MTARYVVTSYSAFRTATAETLDQAAEVAERFAREGNLPSTITEDQGRQWHKWAGSPL